MSNLTPPIQGYYSLNTFQILRDLWQQMAIMVGEDVRSITNAEVMPNRPAEQIEHPTGIDLDRSQTIESTLPNLPQFSLLQSRKFQALLTGRVVNLASLQQMEIKIVFAPQEIDRFIQPLIQYLPSTVQLIANDQFTNDSQLQSHFTQLLLTAITSERIYNNSAVLTDREIQLQQQVAEAHLLNYISTQIHQTLDLPVILQATVEQVQTFLHADRLIIYQFEFTKINGQVNSKGFDTYTNQGRVAYEALGIPNLSSVLNITEQQDCFNNRQLWDKYQGGMTRSINRVELEYAHDQCILALMAQSQVKSKLVVPIIVNAELWGLLIAHQCQSPRHWEVRETRFLQQVAEHLAFAIHQSELYAASLWHNQSLEQRVNERTRELRDAVIVAQTANQSKTEFLALLSHELRTPLTSILGLSATLLRLPLVNLTDRQQKYLQIIHSSGEHLSELIDDILDFYKLEVGKTFLKVSEFSLSKLINQVIEIVRSKAEQGKIFLEVQIINNGDDVTQISGRDLRFRGDNKRIRQILLNILINAIKFTPEHGKVVVRTWLEDRYAVFEIEDSGIGISEEQIPRLFKKFQQLNPNYDRDYAGMGLGLAITQQLVDLHGGWIDVDSILGSGSTFTVRVAAQPLQLPVDSNDWDEMDRKLVFQDPELNPIPKRIILIEQDEDIANFICDILTAARYQVTWLLSADSSFRQIAMFEADLLIINLTMGDQTVDRLIYNIRKSSTISKMSILAIASKEDILSPIVKQYIDDYLWNQVNPEQLLRKITKLLSHSALT
jgi:two-component system, sensor histidine kinase and response regulator